MDQDNDEQISVQEITDHWKFDARTREQETIEGLLSGKDFSTEGKV